MPPGAHHRFHPERQRLYRREHRGDPLENLYRMHPCRARESRDRPSGPHTGPLSASPAGFISTRLGTPDEGGPPTLAMNVESSVPSGFSRMRLDTGTPLNEYMPPPT